MSDFKVKVDLIKQHLSAKDDVIDKQVAQIELLTKELGDAQLKLQQSLPAAPADAQAVSDLTIAQSELGKKLAIAQADLVAARDLLAAQKAEFMQTIDEIDAAIVGGALPIPTPTVETPVATSTTEDVPPVELPAVSTPSNSVVEVPAPVVATTPSAEVMPTVEVPAPVVVATPSAEVMPTPAVAEPVVPSPETTAI